jgi:NYN domain
MADRSAIFIDAGYLLAAGGLICCGTKDRSRFVCDHQRLTMDLGEWAREHSGGMSSLRTYWYDGAKNAVPTPEHEKIGGLPYVKVRLGRIHSGQQKGVDALIYRDLMTLARERAVARAYLLSGDEDLREGVIAAQDMGVQVILIGIPTSQRANQSGAVSSWPRARLHPTRRQRRATGRRGVRR